LLFRSLRRHDPDQVRRVIAASAVMTTNPKGDLSAPSQGSPWNGFTLWIAGALVNAAVQHPGAVACL
jgi:hypothetical protein